MENRQIHFECPLDLASAFDSISKALGYTSRQEALISLMRNYVVQEGPQIAHLISTYKKKTKTRS